MCPGFRKCGKRKKTGAVVLLRRRGRSSRSEAFTAEYGTALCRFEGHGRLLAALRTGGARFGFCEAGPARRGSSQNRYPLRLARLASFGFVLELLIVEEQLFSGSKDEVAAAVDTFEHFILEFHDRSPHSPLAITRHGNQWLPRACAQSRYAPPSKLTAPLGRPACTRACAGLMRRS